MNVASRDGRTLFATTGATSFERHFHAGMAWLLVIVAVVGFTPRMSLPARLAHRLPELRSSGAGFHR
jgi:hypothetical protein